MAALKGASNRLINVEDLSEDEVNALLKHYQKLADLTKDEVVLTASHSIDEAKVRHEQKKKDNG